MTVAAPTSAVTYTGTGTTSVFPFTWQVNNAADLVVYTWLPATGVITQLALNTGYTLTGIGSTSGGTVTLVAGNLPSGTSLFIASDPALVQALTLNQAAAFNASDIMNQLDYLTREVQAARRIANNGMQIPVVESLAGLTTVFPAATQRALKFAYFDAFGNVSAQSSYPSNTGGLVPANIQQVAINVAALRAYALVPAAGYQIATTGYYQAGDIGASIYWWNASDTRSDNGGTVIQITGVSTGRWNLRTYGNAISLAAFGAGFGQGAAIDTAAVTTASAVGGYITAPQATAFAWVSLQAYPLGAQVSYGGSYYACILAVTSSTAPPSDATHWQAIAAPYYAIGAIAFGSNVTGFIGEGSGNTIFTASGTITASSPLLYFNGCANIEVAHFQVNVSTTAYPTLLAVKSNGCQNHNLHDVSIPAGGAYGIVNYGGSGITIRDCVVTTFLQEGILCDQSWTQVLIDNCTVAGGGASHNIQLKSGSYGRVTNCYSQNATIFGISAYLCMDVLIDHNITVATLEEGINVEGTLRFSVLNNTVTCQTGHQDFGLSVYGNPATPDTTTHGLVSGNRIYFPGKAGIALAGQTQYVLVIGNDIISPNALNLSNNSGAGIVLYGGNGGSGYTLCNNNTIQANRVTDQSGNVKTGVAEWNDGTGTPGVNYFRDNTIFGPGITAENVILNAASRVWDTTFITGYAATITATSGTITTASATLNYKRQGDRCIVEAYITITNNGTGSGALQISLPIVCNGSSVGACMTGRENVTNGWSVVGEVTAGASTMVIRNYNNAYPVASTSVVQISGEYPI